MLNENAEGKKEQGLVSIDTITFDSQGLIPAVVQHYISGEVLMVAYMNKEALTKTLATKETIFYSRSRQTLWHKGETSGNRQKVISLSVDCDQDCLLVKVDPAGPACHTGKRSCFYRDLMNTLEYPEELAILQKLAEKIKDVKVNPPEKSYTAYLLETGVDKICKKVGEESSEVIIAAKNNDPQELINESADLLYHLSVLWENNGITVGDVMAELTHRSEKTGNKKEIGHLDKTF